MYDGQKPPAPLDGGGKRSDEWGSVGRDARFLNKIFRFLAKMNEGDRHFLLSFAQNLTKKQRRAAARGEGLLEALTIVDELFGNPETAQKGGSGKSRVRRPAHFGPITHYKR